MDKTLGPFKNAVNQRGNKSTPPFPPDSIALLCIQKYFKGVCDNDILFLF